MNNELSLAAEKRLLELKNLQLFEAAITCVEKSFTNGINEAPDLIKSISKYLQSNHPDCYLFADSTAVQGQDTIKQRASNWAKTGFRLDNILYKLETPFKWQSGVEKSRNHRYKIQAWTMLDEILRASVIDEKNRKFLNISQNIAINWINNYLFGDAQEEFTWYDMGVGKRSSLLAYITNRGFFNYSGKKSNSLNKNIDTLQVEDLLKMLVACEVHMIQLMDEGKLASHSNHGLFQMAGLLAISSSLPMLHSSKVAKEFALEKIELMLKKHFFEDGFHKEHSPMYHVLMSNFLYQLISSGWLEFNSDITKLSRLSIENASYYIMPNGKFSPIGDTYMRYNAEDLCLFDVHRDAGSNPSAPSGLRIFKQGGVAILSTPDKFGLADEHLLFSAQFHSRQHKQADDLSLNYCVNKHPYLIDAGTYRYDYAMPERMYVESTRAHNTIEIDGMNNSRFRLDAYGSNLVAAIGIGDCTFLESRIQHKNLVPKNIPNNQVKTTDGVEVDISHRRIVVSKPKHFLAVIDILDSDSEHEYSQWFHFADRLNLDKVTEKRIEVEDISGLTKSTVLILSDSDVETSVFRGQKEPEFIGWHSIDGLKLEENSSLVSRVRGKSVVLSSIIDLTGKGKSPYVKVGSNGKYVRFSFNTDGKFDLTIRQISDRTYNLKCIDGSKESQKECNWG